MELDVLTQSIENVPRQSEWAERIGVTIRKCQEAERPFFILILQLDNLEAFCKRHPRYVSLNMMRDLYQVFRRSIPSNLYVGPYKNGFGFIVDTIEVGMVDSLARGLGSLAMKVIRDGHFNDMSTRWTEIIRQFLFPQDPLVLIPRLGWAIFPRDGQDADSLIRRAFHHLNEFNR